MFCICLLYTGQPAALNLLWSDFLFKYHSRNTKRLLTHTCPLSERHEGAEDAVNVLGSVLDGEASLQLQCAIIVDHPANADGATTDQIQCKHIFRLILRGTGLCIKSQCRRHRNVCLYKERPALTDLYSSSLLTQALTSREGSLASRLIQDRADILQMELPSLTTRRLALVSFPVGVGMVVEGGRQKQEIRNSDQQQHKHVPPYPDTI